MPTALPAWWSLSTLQIAIEVAATLAFALSGLLAGARARFDAVGLAVVAGLAAFGGGTLRDVLLDRRPFFWVEHSHYVWLVLGLTIAALLFVRQRHLSVTARASLWPDALGLGLFAASGTQIALAAQMPALIAVLMGMATAVAGGVLRDVVCNQVPTIFVDHRPYAILAFAGGWVLVAAQHVGVGPDTSLALAAATTTVLRLLALAFDWRLPAWRAGAAEPPA